MSLTVNQPLPDWLERLGTLRGVLNVLPADAPNSCPMVCQLGQDLRDALSQFVVSQGYGLLELKPLSLSLEEVFLQLTHHEEAGMDERNDLDSVKQSSRSEQPNA